MTEKKLQIKKQDSKMYEVGLLALQGDFELHAQAFTKLGHAPLIVKKVEDLERIKRLVIPGGETTTMSKLIDLYGFHEPLIEFGKSKPVWGTCAGLIMLAVDSGDKRVRPLGLIDIDAERNAYGSQVHSFTDFGEVSLNGDFRKLKMVFIRAPKIKRVGDKVITLGYHGKEVVFARQDKILVTSFHPELTDSIDIHEYFLNLE